MISRRNALRGAGGLVGAAAIGQLSAQAAQSPLLFHSPRLAKFVDDLPVLPVLTGGDLTVPVAGGGHRFHRDLPSVPSLGYGGLGHLGPVIEAWRGVPTTLRMPNRMGKHPFAADIDTSLHGAAATDRTAPRTVTHLHGGVTPPASDGHGMAVFGPGEEGVYTYPNDQPATTLWYHDHAMGMTRLNLYAGLAAPYLLRDRYDTGAPGPLGLPTGEFELTMMLQEKIFTADGKPNARSTPTVPKGDWEPGAVGDVGLVNGKVWPRKEVARGLYRLRLINAGSFSVWRLHWSNRMPFWVIGTDGGLLDAPVRTTSVRLGPAERIDLLVDFGTLRAGETVELRNDERPPAIVGVLGAVAMPVFCRFTAAAGKGFTGGVPGSLRGGTGQPARLPEPETPDRTRTASINMLIKDIRLPPVMMALNNQRHGDTPIERPRQGTVEQWDLVNLTPEPHQMHVHLVQFRVLGRQPISVARLKLLRPRPSIGTRWAPSADPFTTGPLVRPPAWEDGWKDTVRADGDMVTRILVRWPTAEELGFDPDAEFPMMPSMPGMGTVRGYMWHCHLLGHEDHQMMLPLRIVR